MLEMNVVVVSPGFPPDQGGVESVTGSIASNLVAQGQNVVVMTHGRARRRQDFSFNGVSVKRYPTYLREFAFSPALALALRKQIADIWHVHAVHSSLPASVWAAKRRPFVLNPHFHGIGHTTIARMLHTPYSPILHEIIDSASAVIAVSEYEAALLADKFAISPHVIPNGVELSRLRSITRTREADGQTQLTIVSRLFPYKQIAITIRALSLLPQEYHLIIQGQGPEARQLERAAARLGVADRVQFHYQRLSEVELWQMIANSDVLLNLSTSEAFSLIVLESLAVGTPVIVSSSMALAEWPNKFPGSVAALSDPTPETVAEAVQGLAGRRISVDLSRYDWKAIVGQLIELYQSVAP
jgi:glycosyltransferase involved in cell wall biosynthesis